MLETEAWEDGAYLDAEQGVGVHAEVYRVSRQLQFSKIEINRIAHEPKKQFEAQTVELCVICTSSYSGILRGWRRSRQRGWENAASA